ncbi:hypothetical protein [Ahniella affigens]|uniref:hypothetical protein n=1 Tax=Ahniella affigens TaxID=2021234 RepID=UPI0011B284EA|nr:hypothetical protein [Ahniella affigens]
MSEELRDKLDESLKRDGVSPRKASEWLCAQIRDLLATDEALVTVGIGEANMTFPIARNLTIDEETEVLLDKGLRILQGQDPRFVGATSAIVRAAIKRAAARNSSGGAKQG